MTLRLLSEAARELDEAFAYYDAQRADLGSEFIAAIEHGYDQIEAYPRAWPKIRREARWYILKKFPYAIVYKERPREIVVVAVSHLSRRREYWVARLRTLSDEP